MIKMEIPRPPKYKIPCRRVRGFAGAVSLGGERCSMRGRILMSEEECCLCMNATSRDFVASVLHGKPPLCRPPEKW